MLINRLDSLCTLVLSGHWPSGRRYVPEAQLHPNAELMGDEMAYTRMIRKPAGIPGGTGPDGEDGEFTVKLLKVKEMHEVMSEGLSFRCGEVQQCLNCFFLSLLLRRKG